MHPAYSVILFTTASGAGYGLLALLGLVGFNHGPASSLLFGLVAIVLALGLITIGLLSSTFLTLLLIPTISRWPRGPL